MSVGKLIRFDDVRGYGFIAPAEGGEDVFVHANDFGDRRHQVHAGMRVEYEVEETDRGLKVASVQILDDPAPVSPAPATFRPATGGPRQSGGVSRVATAEDDGMCDVLTAQELTAELTELLLQHVPTLSAAQITQVRTRLVDHARSHGWVES